MIADPLFLSLLTGACALFLGRLLLILSGMLKDPVLRQLRSYSDTLPSYFFMPALFLWIALFMLFFSMLMMEISDTNFPVFLSSCAPFLLAYLATRFPGMLIKHGWVLLPAWYRALQSYAARDDQRRVAYMWLSLPPRLRWRFSVNDRAFLQWADLVLLTAGVFVEDVFVYQREYHLSKRRQREDSPQSEHT